MTRSTRITVDLGSGDLFKAVKIASVEQDKTIREIVIEALEAWLILKKDVSEDKNFQSMIQTIDTYRKTYGNSGEA